MSQKSKKPSKPAAKPAAKTATKAPIKAETPELVVGAGVFYSPSAEEQEHQKLNPVTQGMIDVVLPAGRARLSLFNRNNERVNVQATYSESKKPGTFVLS